MDVVSYRNSTSNHNNFPSSYEDPAVVSYRNSTSNHNRTFRRIDEEGVVSYRNSTSNHNILIDFNHLPSLYLIEILHQTTTGGGLNFDRGQLYLIEILHQTTTGSRTIFTCRRLYLIEILHQTTTRGDDKAHQYRCILSKFYIKPQQLRKTHGEFFVVSYRNSTSNHNTTTIFRRFALLYLIEILHQTTTVFFPFLTVLVLYLIEILHQTTTHGPHVKRFRRCILSKFYIKPQLCRRYLHNIGVVSYRNSTSNHNLVFSPSNRRVLYLIEILHQTTTHYGQLCRGFRCILSKFYIKPQLSALHCLQVWVVSYRNSTSNHNYPRNICLGIGVVSYRNSTSNHNSNDEHIFFGYVVSYRNSTSNHNVAVSYRSELWLYLIEILHQTTTK